MRLSDLTVAIGLSKGYRDHLRACLATIPPEVNRVISWYGPGEPDDLPPKTTLVRPRRHTENYMRGYVLNVAIQATPTPFVVLSDADSLYPKFFFAAVKPAFDRVLRFYLARMTAEASRWVLAGNSWEDLYADYQGVHNRLFSAFEGIHNPCIYPTEALRRVRGYDERIVGWGGEDDDLTWRTRRLRLKDVRLPLLVASLYDADVRDYAAYQRGKKPRETEALLRSWRPIVTNRRGWGDAEIPPS